MNVDALGRRITEFCYKLLEKEYALDAQAHVVRKITDTRMSLMWARSDNNASLIIDSPFRIMSYISLLERKEYSLLMQDGAFVQISYIFERGKIIRHRLVYYPCPFFIDMQLASDPQVGLVDLLRDVYLEDLEANVALRSPVRFDLAPEAASDYHPASHMSFNEQTCRVPVRAPLRFDCFMKFIFENFYPHILCEESVRSPVQAEHDTDGL